MPRVKGSGIQIRRGAHADLEQIRQFTRKTFSWGDYLPDVWARWVASKHGDLMVATEGELVVGTARVSFLGNGEAWLEGVRVRDEFRKRGVASCLIRQAHVQAIGQKCRVIRLETGQHNIAARRAFKKFGYHRIVGYASFKGKARAGEPAQVKGASPTELDSCWRLWQHSWLKRASRDIVPAPFGWRWWKMTRARLAQEIRANRVWTASHGFMVLRDQGAEIDISLLVGARGEAKKLLDAARMISARANKKSVSWVVVDSPVAHRFAAQSEFALDDDGLEIYALDL